MSLNTGYLTSDRKKNELYTPYYAVDHIMKYIPKNKIIWCPFDNPDWSAFSKTFAANGYTVISSCLENGQDFFTYEPDEWDIIVSNPPFNIKDKILERIYSFNKPFAIILPLNSLQGAARFQYFTQGIQLLSFDGRICYHNPDDMSNFQKGCPFASAYFCRNVLPYDLIVESLRVYDKPLIE